MKTQLIYFFAVLKDTTFRRIANYIAMQIAYRHSLLFGRPFLPYAPVAISVEPVRGCNLSCGGCPAGNIKGADIKNINPDLFRKIIDEVSRHTFYLQLWFQGEPLLHPEIDYLIKYSRTKGMFTVIATNGILLNGSLCETLIRCGLHKIIVTIDVPGNKDSFSVGGNYKKGRENLEMLTNLKKKYKTSFPLIEAQMIVTSHNEKECDTFRKDMKDAGADTIKLKSAWFPDLRNPDLPVPEKHSRYRKNTDGTWRTKMPLHNKCMRIFTTMVVTYNGDVVPCCFDKGCNHIIGNISDHPLMNIWKNAGFRQFRLRILKDRKGVSMCRNCTS